MTTHPTGKQGRLFANPLLEKLTLTTPGLIWGLYAPILTFALGYALTIQHHALWLVGALFAAGVFVWSLAEYFLHRYLFHWVNENKFVQRFHYLMHGFHHDFPRDTNHLFMPPLPSLILASLFWGLFSLLLGAWTPAFWPGFMVGYLGYSTMHYAMHTVTNPPKFLRNLWRHHQLHHHKAPDKAFGVSSPLWDHVFRTLPEAPAR